MHLKKIVILSLFLAVYNVIYTQDQSMVDSLLANLTEAKDTNRYNTLRELYKTYIYVDYQVAKTYLDDLSALAQTLAIPNLIAESKNLEGIYLSVISENEAAVATYQEGIRLYEALGNRERVSALMNNASNCYRRMGHLAEALDWQMQSLKIKEDLGVDGEKLSASYWNIGNIHGDIGNYAESNVWYRKAEQFYESAGLIDDLAHVRYNMALNYKETDSLEQALPIFQQALDYYEANNLNNDLAGVYDNLGEMYYDNGELTKAETYLKKSLSISENHGEKSLIGLTYRRLGLVYIQQGRYDEAIAYIQKAVDIAKVTLTRKNMINDYLALAQAYAGKGNYKLAYAQYQLHDSLKSEVMSEENIKRLNELEIKYQTEKKEQEIALQENQIQLLKQKAATVRAQRTGLIFGLLAIILLFSSTYFALQQKFKRQQLEKQQLGAELDYKKKELTSFTLQLSHKNEILEGLKKDIKILKTEPSDPRKYNRLINTIDINIKDDANWESFKMRFEEVHKNFNANIKKNYPTITANELRLMALLKMNLSSKEIATLLNISQEGVKKARQRLRKKMELEPEMPLEDVIFSL